MTGALMTTVGSDMVHQGSTSRPPAFVPMLPYPGVGIDASTQSVPAYTVPAFPFAAGWSPTPSYSYSQPTFVQAGMSGARSWLQGYQPNAPIVAVPAGTPLIHGHLFASHIFGLLQRFGSLLNQPQLMDLASKLFSDATGFLPGGNDVAILGQIVERFLQSRSSPGTDLADKTYGGGAAAAQTITIVITVKGPENVQVKVDSAAGQNTSVVDQRATTQPGPGRPAGENDSQVSNPPPAAPAPRTPTPTEQPIPEPLRPTQATSPLPPSPGATPKPR
jgi:hypothetical protein